MITFVALDFYVGPLPTRELLLNWGLEDKKEIEKSVIDYED
jgi:hypothetical protein